MKTTHPSIHWTLRASREMRRSLAKRVCACPSSPLRTAGKGDKTAGNPNPEHACEVLKAWQDVIGEILRKTFRDAHSIVVMQQLRGYRPSDEKCILLIETFGDEEGDAFGRDEGGRYVIRIGPPEVIDEEAARWNCCRPVGLRHDIVFLPLQMGGRVDKGTKENGPPSLASVYYGDAQQLIGVEQVVTFEEAAIKCVLTGLPTIESVLQVIDEIYERMGHLLYSQSFVDDPAYWDTESEERTAANRAPGSPAVNREQQPDLLPYRHLGDAVNLWENRSHLDRIRRQANSAPSRTPDGEHVFQDPIDYLRFLEVRVPWLLHGTHESNSGPRSEERTLPAGEGDSGLGSPEERDVIPRSLRGCAHGDLHGRNILVAVVHDRAMWPAVFDYEDMGSCNPIGWDFVKLETELKIRCLATMVRRKVGGLVPEAAGYMSTECLMRFREFEQDLNLSTEKYHRASDWKIDPGEPVPTRRLKRLMLEIRRMASNQMGTDRGRPNDWLEEYYFLLMCYGVRTSRFPNLPPIERLAAYLSAGMAAAHLSYVRRRLREEWKLTAL